MKFFKTRISLTKTVNRLNLPLKVYFKLDKCPWSLENKVKRWGIYPTIIQEALFSGNICWLTVFTQTTFQGFFWSRVSSFAVYSQVLLTQKFLGTCKTGTRQPPGKCQPDFPAPCARNNSHLRPQTLEMQRQVGEYEEGKQLRKVIHPLYSVLMRPLESRVQFWDPCKNRLERRARGVLPIATWLLNGCSVSMPPLLPLYLKVVQDGLCFSKCSGGVSFLQITRSHMGRIFN